MAPEHWEGFFPILLPVLCPNSSSSPSFPFVNFRQSLLHLRKEIEASKAAHDAVNFRKTLPFPIGLSRETNTKQTYINM